MSLLRQLLESSLTPEVLARREQQLNAAAMGDHDDDDDLGGFTNYYVWSQKEIPQDVLEASPLGINDYLSKNRNDPSYLEYIWAHRDDDGGEMEAWAARNGFDFESQEDAY